MEQILLHLVGCRDHCTSDARSHKLQVYKLHNLFSLPNIRRKNTSRRQRRSGYVACLGVPESCVRKNGIIRTELLMCQINIKQLLHG